MTIDGWSIFNSLMPTYNAILARSKQIPAFLNLKRVDGLLSAVNIQDKYTVKTPLVYILIFYLNKKVLLPSGIRLFG